MTTEGAGDLSNLLLEGVRGVYALMSFYLRCDDISLLALCFVMLHML